jgi:molybdenum cofactor guanylyltransferase
MGTDKAWLPLDEKPMIEHVINALAPATDAVAIIANSPRFRRFGFEVFADSQNGVGPLEAIRTALANSRTSRVLLVGCDLPFVTTELFRLLLSIESDHYAIVPIGADGRQEPLCAIYDTRALPAVSRLIEHGVRKISMLFDIVPTFYVPFEHINSLPGSDLFFENINTPDDYERVRKLSAQVLGKVSPG